MKRLAVLLLCLACRESTAPHNVGTVAKTADVSGIPYFSAIQIGQTVLQEVRGTHGVGTRLGIYGVGSNSAEVELVPGPACCPIHSIASQIQLFGPADSTGYVRLVLTMKRDSGGNDIGVLDMSSSGTRPLAPIEINMGIAPSILIHSDGSVEVKK